MDGISNRYGAQGPRGVPLDQSSRVNTHPQAKLVNGRDLKDIRVTVKQVTEDAITSKSQRNEAAFSTLQTVALIALAIFVGVATHGIGIAVALGAFGLVVGFKAIINAVNYSNREKQDAVVDDATDHKLSQLLATKPLSPRVGEDGRLNDGYNRPTAPFLGQYPGQRVQQPSGW